MKKKKMQYDDLKIEKKELTTEERKNLEIKKSHLLNVYEIEKKTKAKEIYQVAIKTEPIYDVYQVGYIHEDGVENIKKATYQDGNVFFETKELGSIALYGKNKNRFFLLPILLFVMGILLFLGTTYSINEEFRDKVNRVYVNTFKVDKPTSPVITGGSKEYAKERVISIEKDALSYNGISHYEYCTLKSKDFEKCNWKTTDTKNAKIYGNGKFYIVFRGISKNNKKGSLSNVEEVYMDNEAPIFKNIKLIEENKSIKVEVTAEDKLSGIDKYYYKLENGKYKEISQNFILEGLELKKEYTLSLVVTDKVGNSKEITQKIALTGKDGTIVNITNADKKEDESSSQDNSQTDNSNNNNQNDNNTNNENNNNNGNNNNNDPNNSNNGNNNDNNNNNNDNNNENNRPNSDLVMPEINLDQLPNSFEYGENYNLPSYYRFDNQGGEVICFVDSNTQANNTTSINIGRHVISCEARGNNGLTARVEKEIEVTYRTAEDEIWDGYILLNLFYPENSTERMWRLGDESDIRFGEDSGWQYYTGPILVRLEDVQNVYIKYNINGEEIIVPPTGRLLVDINPLKYTLNSNETTKVKITYDASSRTKEYKINDGPWQNYEGEFEVGPNTMIEARGTKLERTYDAQGNLLMEKTVTGVDSVFIRQFVPTGENVSGEIGDIEYGTTPGGSGSGNGSGGGSTSGGTTGPSDSSRPSTYLEGPNILLSTDAIAESVSVSLTTDEEARTIYYSINNGSYIRYTGTFEVNQNCLIKAYYVRESDGKVSSTSYKRVRNIRQGNKPYLDIIVDPDPYLENETDSVTVTLRGTNYDTIEYSFDGIYYVPYTQSFTINTNRTIYAKATNRYGTTKQKLVINNLNQVHTPEADLNIGFVTNSVENGLEVSITYDEEATMKVYKIGSNDSWHTYTGPFVVNENTTIYAYATSATKTGYATKIIQDFNNGLTDPEIIAIPGDNTVTSRVEVSINFDSNATIKQYRINDGELQNYTRPFYVEENATIYAYSEDGNGNIADAELEITNIVPLPSFILEYDMYYLIKLNYPSTSLESSREYKWKSDGDWKLYNKEGILLIKPEYREEVTQAIENETLEIENENGETISFSGDWYLLDVPLSEISENLYMRWDSIVPGAPEIMTFPETWATSVNVGIIYPANASNREYKLIYDDGTTSDWQPYTGMFSVNQNNTVVYARYENNLGVTSNTSSLAITKIDTTNPVINNASVTESTPNTITINAVGIDLESGIKKYYYSTDGINYQESSTGVFTISNLHANCEHLIRIYVEDQVGNQSEIYTVIGRTENIEAPIITIEENDKWTTEKRVTISHKDENITLQYSLNDGQTWTSYENPFLLDRNVTILAKASDGRNERTSQEEITLIDTTKPEISSINVLERSTKLIVNIGAFDNESDIKEYYYSLDGINYQKSENRKITISGLTTNKEYTIYVKVENHAGLMSEIKTTTAITTNLGALGFFITPANNKWGYEKEVEIDYPTEEDTGYLNQYSLDNGTTWLPYTNSFVVSEENQTIIARVLDGADVKASATFKVTKIDDTQPTINLDQIPDTFFTDESYALPSEYTVNEEKSGGKATCTVDGRTYTNTNQLKSGSNLIECTVTTGAGKTATVTKEVNAIYRKVSTRNSILKILQDDSLEGGYYTFKVNDEKYAVHLYVIDGSQNWTSNQTFGDEKDVATATTNARNMVIVKVKGDVTIAPGVTVGPYYDPLYGGPKGFTLYVVGKLINNGTIDNSHGAKAEGQNVYLWKNADGTYETVSKEGGVIGTAGNIENRQTGGGSNAGAGRYRPGGNGTAGTSYSGGTGGGSSSGSTVGNSGQENGGAGGTGLYSYGAGGAGNPGGARGSNTAYAGQNGTGGLLVVYADGFENNGKLTANGYSGGIGAGGNGAGGSSGAGSINIFTSQDTKISQYDIVVSEKYAEILGQTEVKGGPNGATKAGDGTVNIGSIRKGQYYDLTEIIEQDIQAYLESITFKGDSILSILEKNDIPSGNWKFVVNGEEYQVHQYTLEGDQHWTTNQSFGSAEDVATATTNARNMVVVKVKGNVTIGENVTVGPYYDSSYGGPKGFILYVTGTLTNNGTIDNSHGAKAEGDNVYLWKNEDGSYAYIAKEGASGAASRPCCGVGYAGANANEHQTGGGASGGAGTNSRSGGAGSAGTSYSGGTGGGGVFTSSNPTGGTPNGGAGGTGRSAGSGAGNPSNGTGGLLAIYASTFENNATIQANGASGGGGSVGGGASGGGSVNIFYKEKVAEGTITANGGRGIGSYRAGGSGGAGSVNQLQIATLSDETQPNDPENTEEIQTMNEEAELLIPNPIIRIDTTTLSESKTVSITYPQGCTLQYSTDFGATWKNYKDEFKITKNTVIFARCLLENEVVSSSSFKITSIGAKQEEIEKQPETIDENVEDKQEELSIELDIPENILVGSNYSLPTSSTGTTSICKINDVEYTNTVDLPVGKYTIVCITTKEEETKEITKEIKVVETLGG